MTDLCGLITPEGNLGPLLTKRRETPEIHLGCHVLLSGFLAERGELRRVLNLDPTRSVSDSEILAHAFRRWGRDLERRVVGEFAAVICDPATGVALLTHDSLGLKPVFHALGPEGLSFSTNLVDLLTAGRDDDLDDGYIADYLAFGGVSSEATPYPAIRRLAPGRALWLANGRFSEIAGWRLADVAALRLPDDRQYEEAFRTALESALRASLEDAGQTWIYLSGGLDSSTIACVAARLGSADLHAYTTLHSQWPEADERRWAAAVIEATGLPWRCLEVETMLPFADPPGPFRGEPDAGVVDAAEHAAQNALLTAHGARTVLTGHGGDTTLQAYSGAVPVHLADPLFEARPLRALREMERWRAGAHERRSISYWLLRGLLEPAADHLASRRPLGREPYGAAPWIRPDYAHEMKLDRRGRFRAAPACATPGRQAMAESLWSLGLVAASVPQRPKGVQTRSPLMHRPLVEFMASIPPDQNLQPRCDRFLQRRALAGVLPETVRARAGKAGGSAALSEGLRRSPEWIDYLCDSPLMAARGIVDADKWRQAVRQAAVGQTHGDKNFRACVALEVWLRQREEHRAKGSAI